MAPGFPHTVPWLAHLCVFCKGGDIKVGGHSFFFADAGKLALCPTIPDVDTALTSGVAAQQELLAIGAEHVWPAALLRFQRMEGIEKLRYLHRNPVVRGLVQEPKQWPWSSHRSYAFGEAGAVRINQWGQIKMKTPAPAA